MALPPSTVNNEPMACDNCAVRVPVAHDIPNTDWQHRRTKPSEIQPQMDWTASKIAPSGFRRTSRRTDPQGSHLDSQTGMDFAPNNLTDRRRNRQILISAPRQSRSSRGRGRGGRRHLLARLAFGGRRAG
uniref:Uncharacterized protein n=1 Tax=Arundo donax TaxID=35708 RepID=A0A0A9CUJ8_ARUDO